MGSLAVNSETRKRERQQLMRELLERKIRFRARQIYEERGRADGRALEDWVKAESDILKTSILAPLWHKRSERESSDRH